MRKIWTLTMNPAIDLGAEVEEVIPNQKLRTRQPAIEPGGGGVNVARALNRMDERSTAIFPVGGPLGCYYKSLLDAENVDYEAVETEESLLRFNINLREKNHANQYRILMPGPELRESEWHQILDLLKDSLRKENLLVVSGSLPSEVPNDFERSLAKIIEAAGARFILDGPGDMIERMKETRIDWITPNQREFEDLLGRNLESDDLEEELVSFIEGHSTENILLTLGSKGAIYAGAEGVRHIPAPEVDPVSAVGAGDSAVAGLVLALAHGRDCFSASQWAVAAGAAAVKTPGSHLLKKSDFEALREELCES